MTIFTNTVQEAYNQLLADSSNSLSGTWEITEDDYLSVTGQSNGSIAMFSTLGALGDFTLEWTSKQLGGSYIHSNLCLILRYTPEDSGIEGGGDNYAMILYLCNYHGDPTGTFVLRTDGGNTFKEYPTVEASIDVNSVHSFKLVRSGSTLTFYEDDILITTTTNLSFKPLYLGWYLWFGGSNENYQTNFILQNYRLEGVLGSIKNYVNKPGVAEIWANIKNYITAQLLGKSDVGHTHTKSEITDFPTIPTKTSDLTNDSGFLTSHQDLSGYVPRSGGAVITNYLLGRSVDTGSLMISGGTAWDKGGSLETFGSSHSSYAGWVRLQPALSNPNFKTMNLAPNGTWAWNGTACQVTSDQRYKQQIAEIDDKLLDAWGDVELVQFKYNESVDTKGKSARLHTGYVVQQINKACTSHGVDITQYGLFCHEEYPKEIKEIEVVQKDGTKTKKTKVIREANEHYSLRYTEALIVECKYLRRCIARLTARIEELEKGNNIK